MSGHSLAKASSMLLVLFVLSRLLGFVREQVIAALLGASVQSDAFVVAATIPFTFSFIIGVSAGNALLPVYTSRLQDPGRARLASTVIYAVGALTALLTAAGWAFTPQVVGVLAPGLAGEARQLALSCTRIMLPSTLLLTLGFLCKAVLNAHREFKVPAMAPVWQNAVFLLLIVPLGGLLGPGLAWCTLAGAAVFYLYNLPAMARCGIPLRPLVDLRDQDVRRVVAMTVPAVLTTLVTRGFIFVDRWFASHLAEGSIAALSFANRVRELPYGMFVAAVSTVLFPALAAAAGRGDMRLLRERTAAGLRLVALVTYPCAALLLVLAVPVVRLLFERGAFDASATAATAAAMGFYALSVAAMSANSVLTYTFLSLRDAVLPMWAGIAGLAVNIALDCLLVVPMGHAGLALGNTVGFFVTAAFFLAALARRLPGFDWRRQGVDQLKICAAALAFAAALRLAGTWTGLYGHLSLPGQMLALTMVLGFGSIAYLLVLLWLGVEEVVSLVKRFIIK